MAVSMKVVVDFDRCESNAVCESLAPDVFEVDDDDFLQIKRERVGEDAVEVESVRRAVASCPRQAISLVEE